MHMWREIGEKPGRKCWFKEGIQLCEATEISVSAENGYDHISLAVDSVPEIMKKIKAYPVTPINEPLVLTSKRNKNRIKASFRLEIE